MTAAVYEIEVVHVDRVEWLDELRETVTAELLGVGLHSSVRVDVVETPASPDVPAVVAVLGSDVAARDHDVAARAEEAMASGLVVLPVVGDLTRFAAECPPPVRHLNGYAFDATGLARVLLRELGIEDRELRVFLSHKRDDGLWAAEQLHDELAHRSYVPFIDRFAVRPALDVQSEIADALEDYAFLLLLETPLAHSSPWVFDEVDYALVRTMAILIVSWPGDVTPVPGSVGLPRLKLEDDEVETNDHGAQVLTPAAIERVVAAVEAAHARGLVRRRRQIIRSIEDAAVAAGARATPLPDWGLLVEEGASRTVVGIAPRLPTAADLQRLDDARTSLGDHGVGLLVHAARVLRADRTKHLAWVTDGRKLELLPENAVGARWR